MLVQLLDGGIRHRQGLLGAYTIDEDLGQVVHRLQPIRGQLRIAQLRLDALLGGLMDRHQNVGLGTQRIEAPVRLDTDDHVGVGDAGEGLRGAHALPARELQERKFAPPLASRARLVQELDPVQRREELVALSIGDPIEAIAHDLLDRPVDLEPRQHLRPALRQRSECQHRIPGVSGARGCAHAREPVARIVSGQRTRALAQRQGAPCIAVLECGEGGEAQRQVLLRWIELAELPRGEQSPKRRIGLRPLRRSDEVLGALKFSCRSGAAHAWRTGGHRRRGRRMQARAPAQAYDHEG